MYSLPKKGKSTFNTIGRWSQSIWILNSRAANPMTPFPKLSNLYIKMTREQLITIAKSDSAPIRGSRNITLESSIVICLTKIVKLASL